MSKGTKFQNFIVDAIANIANSQDGALTARAKYRNQLLQDVSSDIQTIITESNLSIEEAINEWLLTSGHSSKNILHRRKFVEDAVRKYPVVVNS